MGPLSVDGLLHRIRAQSPSKPTLSGLCTDGWGPFTLPSILHGDSWGGSSRKARLPVKLPPPCPSWEVTENPTSQAVPNSNTTVRDENCRSWFDLAMLSVDQIP